MAKRHLILGNGAAAISAVRAIRSVSLDDEIVVAAKEACPAYSGVLFTPYLSGRIPYEALFIADDAFYRDHRATLLLSQEAVRVAPTERRVAFADGGRESYDELLIAVGAAPRPAVASDAAPILDIRTIGDASRLAAALADASTVAIIGAGLVGLEVADAAAQRGKAVVLIGRRDRLAPRVLDDGAAALLAERMRERGVALCLADQVAEIAADGRIGLQLASGRYVEADVVVNAAGVAPNVGLVAGSGIRVNEGIVVDERCRTSVASVYAAGDVAEAEDAVEGQLVVNATWPNAVEQGWTAGLNMAGRPATRPRRPRANVTSLFGLDIASVGAIVERAGRDSVTTRSHSNYRRLFFEGERLVGAVLVGDIIEAGVLANVIERGPSSEGPASRQELVAAGGLGGLARLLRHTI